MQLPSGSMKSQPSHLAFFTNPCFMLPTFTSPTGISYLRNVTYFPQPQVTHCKSILFRARFKSQRSHRVPFQKVASTAAFIVLQRVTKVVQTTKSAPKCQKRAKNTPKTPFFMLPIYVTKC